MAAKTVARPNRVAEPASQTALKLSLKKGAQTDRVKR
jgi:hypothetical protein